MKRMWLVLVAVCLPIAAPTESSYPQATVPGAYPAWPVVQPTTPAGAAMNGMASVISSAGDYNLSTSAAAINMTQAQRQEIQNRQEATNAYFQMQEVNRAARAAKAGPRPTMEQIVRIAKDGMPKPLSPSEVDPANGRISWPGVLQLDQFASPRSELEQLMSKRALYGGLGFQDQMECRRVIDTMVGQLKLQIREVPSEAYMASRNFLRSLQYTISKSELD